MGTSNLQEISQWVLVNGYFLMFILMLIEGPAVTAAGAFVAALGYFNIWLVFSLSILGNLIPDVIYYALGFWGRKELVEKYGHYLKITKERMEKLETLYREHVGKTLIAVKLIPVFATPGLIIAGIARVPLRKYAWWSLIVTIPSSLLYLIVGYYFGAIYGNITKYIQYGGYIIITAIAIFIITSYASKKLGRKLSEKIGGADNIHSLS